MHFLARLCDPACGNLFGAAGGFQGGSVPPFGCIGLRTSFSARLHRPPLPMHAWHASVFVFICVCVLPWQLTGAFSSLQLFPFTCACVYLPFPVFLLLSISPSITITLSPSLISQPVTLVALNFPPVAYCCCTDMAVVRGVEGQSWGEGPYGVPPEPPPSSALRGGAEWATGNQTGRLRTCRRLWPPADLRGQHNPQKRWDIWSKPPRETRQLPSGSSRMPKPLPRPYRAKSAKVRATAEPTSARINRHTRAFYDGPHRRPDAAVMGTASGSSCPLLSTAPTNRAGKGCGACSGWHRALVCAKSHS